MKIFTIYNLMFLILEELYEETKNENLNTFLSEANPYVWEGENSGDPAIYSHFKLNFKDENYVDYAYDYIVDFLSNQKYYDGIVDIFKSLSKEEYVDTCDHIIKDQPQLLKEIKC